MAVNIFALSGLAASGPAVVFALLAVVLPYMESDVIKVGNVTMETSMTLWRSCTEMGDEEICGDSLDMTEWGAGERGALKAARATTLLGFFCTVPALVLLLLFLTFSKDRRNVGLVGGGLEATAGTFFVVSIAVFVAVLKQEGYDYTAGFAFDVLACFSSWTGVLLIVLAVLRNTGEVSALLL